MYPCDICEVIAQFKHPLWYTWGIEKNRWGKRQRDSVGLFAEHGSLWFATAITHEDVFDGGPPRDSDDTERPRLRTIASAVPCNELPYKDIVTARRQEGTTLFRGGTMQRGWHPLLKSLCSQGFLGPDARLSALLDEDTWKIVPHHFCL